MFVKPKDLLRGGASTFMALALAASVASVGAIAAESNGGDTAAQTASAQTASSSKASSKVKTAAADDDEDTSKEVKVPDENLAKVIRSTLGLDADATITENKMAKLTELKAENAGIKDLTGLNKATNLEVLDLSGNDLSAENKLFSHLNNAMFNMTKLTSLDLSNCHLGDSEPILRGTYFYNATKLEHLDLSNNNLSGWVSLCESGTTSAVFPLKKLKTANFSNNNFSSFLTASNAKMPNLEKIDFSNNRFWVDENSVASGQNWYKCVVQLGSDKFDFSNQKELCTLTSAWMPGDGDSYRADKVTSRINNDKKTIDLGTTISDSVTFNLSYPGNEGDLKATPEGGKAVTVAGDYSDSGMSASLSGNTYAITWDGLKAGENTQKVTLKIGNETAVYTAKIKKSTKAEATQDSAGINDSALQTAVCRALGIDTGTDVTKEQMASLTGTLSASGVKDASGLQYATGLTGLSLSGSYTSLPDLSGLTKLTSLTLKGDYTGVPGLSSLTNLTSLTLGGNGSTPFSVDVASGSFKTPDLSKLTKLKNVVIRSNAMDTAPVIASGSVGNLAISQARDGSWPSLESVKGNFLGLVRPQAPADLSACTNLEDFSIETTTVPDGFFKALSLPSDCSVDLSYYDDKGGSVDLSSGDGSAYDLSVRNMGSGVLTLKGENDKIDSLSLDNYTSSLRDGTAKAALDSSLRLPETTDLTINNTLASKVSDATVASMKKLSSLTIMQGYEDGTVPSSLITGTAVSLTSLTIYAAANGMNLDGVDLSKATNLQTLILNNCGKWLPEKLPSSLTDLMITGGTFTTLENQDWSNVTGLTRLDISKDRLTEFPSKLVKNNPNLSNINLSHGLYSDIPADAFDNSTSPFMMVKLGNWLKLDQDENGNWKPFAGTGLEQALKAHPNIYASYDVGRDSGWIDGGNYSSLVSVTSDDGTIDANPMTDSNMSLYVPAGSTQAKVTFKALLPDTVIKVDGKEYKSGDTVTLPLTSASQDFKIQTENSYTNSLDFDTTSSYTLTVAQGQVMDTFDPKDGGVYDVGAQLMREGTDSASMAGSYFQNRAVVRYHANAEKGKKYDIRITTTKASWITDLRYQDADGNYQTADIVSEDTSNDTRTYRIYADSLDNRIKVSPRVVPMGGGYPVCELVVSKSGAVDITASTGSDTAELTAAITKAQGILDKRDIYTADSHSALEKALAAAKRTASQAATQATVDEAAKALNDAINGLAVDKSKLANLADLNEALNSAKALTKDGHSDSAWETLQEAIADARAVAGEQTSSQSEVNLETSALNRAVKLFTTSGAASTLDSANLADGEYSVYVDMINASDTSAKSMSDKAVTKPIKITVKDGKYTATVNMHGINITLGDSTMFGYLKELSYWDGKEYKPTNVTGSYDVVDAYNDANKDGKADFEYPEQMTFPLVNKNKGDADGYVKLQVFVPIMESISKGSGTQQVLMKIDWTSLVKGSGAATDAADAQDARNTLNALIAGANNVAAKGSYSSSSLNKLKTAITAAQKVANSDASTKAQLNSAARKLSSAMSALKKKATSVTVGGITYKVSGKSAVAASGTKSIKKASVRAAVKIGGRTYKVAGVKAKAFKGCKKLKSLAIGKNVKSIGKQAFQGCKKLKTVTVKTKRLAKRSVRGSLRGSSVKAVKVKVGNKKTNKKYAKKYKKIFTKANAGKKPSVK